MNSLAYFFLVNKIFPDLKVYLTMEEEQDKHYYSSKIRELQDGVKGRKRNKGDGSPLTSVGSIFMN